MKRIYTLFTLSVIVFSSCQKDDDPVIFDYQKSYEVEIPAPVVLDNFHKQEVTIEGDQVLADHNTSVQQIKEVWLQEVVFTISDPEQRDFSFLESTDIYIKADGLSTERIAFRTDINGNDGTITLHLDHLNLASYFKKNKFELLYSADADGSTTSATMVNVEFVYEITALSMIN